MNPQTIVIVGIAYLIAILAIIAVIAIAVGS